MKSKSWFILGKLMIVVGTLLLLGYVLFKELLFFLLGIFLIVYGILCFQKAFSMIIVIKNGKRKSP